MTQHTTFMFLNRVFVVFFTHVCFFALADALREVSLLSAAAADAAAAAAYSISSAPGKSAAFIL
jgi:hypothetical protein